MSLMKSASVYRAVVVCLAVVPLMAPALAGPTADGTPAAPRIQFTDVVHDFGTAVSGEDLSTTFEFVNAGDAVLVIRRVKGG